MRAGLDGATAALYASGRYDVHHRIRVENGSGTLKSMEGRYKGGTLNFSNPNEPIASLSVEFLREMSSDGLGSLSPLMQGSTWNRLDDGVTFSPQIQMGRLITYDVALTAFHGARPADGATTWYEVFRGTINDPRMSDEKTRSANVSCTDMAGLLKKAKSEQAYVYEAGTSIESTIRKILDNNGFYWIAFDCPVPTAKVLEASYAPGVQKTVWDQIWSVAQSIVWLCWFKYSGQSTLALTLFDPPREKVTTDWTVPRYDDVRDVGFNEAELGNVGFLLFWNENMERITIGPIEDLASIDRYGGATKIRRAFWIVLDKESPVRAYADALAMLVAALSDVADPDVLASVPTPAWPFVECASDLYLFQPRAPFFDTAQAWAPFTSSMTFRAHAETTSLTSCRGRPSAGSKGWQVKQGVITELPSSYYAVYNLRFDDAAETATHFALLCDTAPGVDALWCAQTVVTGQPDDAKWDANALLVAPVTGQPIMVAKPSAALDEVTLVQLEGRYYEPRTGLLLAGGVQRHVVFPPPAEPPEVKVRPLETETDVTVWLALLNRGIDTSSVQFRKKLSTEGFDAWEAPTRDVGDASAVNGGTLGTDEFEFYTALAVRGQSVVQYRYTLASGEVVEANPMVFDRDKTPTIIDVRIEGTLVTVAADFNDTLSLALEHVGGSWRMDADGNTAAFDVALPDSSANAGLGSTTRNFRVIAYAKPKSLITGGTLTDWRDIVVSGVGAPSEPSWTGDIVAAAPAFSSDEVTLHLKATSAPVGHTVRVTEVHHSHGAPWSVEDDITTALSPSITAPPTSATDYAFATGFVEDGGGSFLVEYVFTMAILNGTGDVVATADLNASWSY